MVARRCCHGRPRQTIIRGPFAPLNISAMSTEHSPRVSVMIPNLDGGRFLGRTVESALGQTRGDLVVRVIDNGSTDDSAAVCARFDDPRLTFEPQPARVGMADNWNRAARAATTEYVALLHADDRWYPDFTARMVAALDADPGVDVAFCGIDVIDDDDRVVVRNIHRHAHARPGRMSARDRDALLRRNTLLAPSWLARRRLFDHAAWDASLRWAPDWDFWLKVFDAGTERITRVTEVLCQYRNHAGSGTFREELVRLRMTEEAELLRRSFARRTTSAAAQAEAEAGLIERQAAVAPIPAAATNDEISEWAIARPRPEPRMPLSTFEWNCSNGLPMR